MNEDNTTSPRPETSPPATTRTGSGSDSGRFFDWLRSLGITRSTDRWIGGVAGGIARYWRIDPLIVRAITVALLIFTSVGWFAYAVAWALLPEERDRRIHAEEAIRGRFDPAYIGIAVFIAMSATWGNEWIGWPFLLSNTSWNWIAQFTNTAISILFVVAAVIFVVKISQRHYTDTSTDSSASDTLRQHSSATESTHTSAGFGSSWQSTEMPPDPASQPQAAPPSRPTLSMRAVSVVTGLTLLAVAAVIIAHHYDAFDGNLVLIASGTALCVIGLGIVVAGITGRSSGVLSGLVTTILIVSSPVLGWQSLSADLDDPQVSALSETTWTPTSLDQASRGYVVAASSATVDLTDVALTTDATTTVPIRLAAGEVTVIVPDDARISAKATMVAGNVDWQISGNPQQDDGVIQRSTYESSTISPQLPANIILDIRGGAGEVIIKEES